MRMSYENAMRLMECREQGYQSLQAKLITTRRLCRHMLFSHDMAEQVLLSASREKPRNLRRVMAMNEAMAESRKEAERVLVRLISSIDRLSESIRTTVPFDAFAEILAISKGRRPYCSAVYAEPFGLNAILSDEDHEDSVESQCGRVISTAPWLRPLSKAYLLMQQDEIDKGWEQSGRPKQDMQPLRQDLEAKTAIGNITYLGRKEPGHA